MTIRDLISINQDYQIIIDRQQDEVVTRKIYQGHLHDVPEDLKDSLIIEIAASAKTGLPVITVE